MLLPRWFLWLNGVGLLLMGGMMLIMRLRAGGALLSTRKMIGLLWSLLCSTAGAVLLLMASGWLSQPGSPPARRPHAGPVFPVDR